MPIGRESSSPEATSEQREHYAQLNEIKDQQLFLDYAFNTQFRSDIFCPTP